MQLIDFQDTRHRLLLLALGIILVCGVVLKIHEYSITAWHEIIDHSPEKETFFEKSRLIRSDDYMLDIPNILAQSSHAPRFPINNRNIAFGQNMNLPHEMPVLGVTALYRPFVWGFLVSPDVGLSFRWWSLVLGLFYTSFLALMIVSRNHFPSSLLLSLGLIYSPYFQSWSFHKAEIVIYGLLTFIAACYFLAANKYPSILLYGALTGYAVSGIALSHVYPAISVPVGWFTLFGMVAFYFDRKEELRFDCISARVAGSILALLIASLTAMVFYLESADVIRLLRETIYPGKRFSVGGGYPLWAFFSHNLGAMLSDMNEMWFQNICESATFVFGFVPLTLILIISFFSSQRIKNPWLWVMTFYLFFIGIYTYLGFPVWLSKITLFGMSTSNRTQIGFGLANAFILSATFSPGFNLDEVARKTINMALIAWGVLLVVSMFWFKLQYPPLQYELAVPFAIANLAAAVYSLKMRKMLVLTAFVTTVSFLASIKLNPVVVGGTDYLFHNPLSEHLSEINSKDASRSSWVVLGDWRISNLLKILGIPSLGGYHNYPHFRIWHTLDPDGKWSHIYNQSGFVTFMASPAQEMAARSVGPGDFEVYVNPGSDAFIKLGVRYFLSCDDNYQALFNSLGNFEQIYRFKNFTVYERK